MQYGIRFIPLNLWNTGRASPGNPAARNTGPTGESTRQILGLLGPCQGCENDDGRRCYPIGFLQNRLRNLKKHIVIWCLDKGRAVYQIDRFFC